MAGNHEDRELWSRGPQPDQSGKARCARQRQVDEGELEIVMGVEHVERAFNRGRFIDVGLSVDEPQSAGQRLAEQGMVVDDQETGHGQTIAQGSSRRKGA
jgi:hypothetical protein